MNKSEKGVDNLVNRVPESSKKYQLVHFGLLALMGIISTVVAQTTTTTNSANSNNACRNGFCSRCDTTGGCLKCIGAVRNTTNNGYCDATITENNCASWSQFPHSYCETCKPGYLINENNKCSKSTIGCCMQGSVVGGQEICTACENTMPNLYRTKCNEKLEIPNCRWGMRQGQLEACAYCKSGYSVFGYGCVPNCVHGCSHCTKAFNGTQYVRKCVECDWNRNFWMTSENVCSGSRLLTLGISGLLGLLSLLLRD